MFKLKKFIIVLLCVLFSLSLPSCNIFEKCFVKKQDYENLKIQLDKSNEKIHHQLEKVRELEIENTGLREEIDDILEKLSAKDEEILVLKEELKSIEIKLLQSQDDEESDDPEKLRQLLYNINNLLKYVYIGSSTTENYGYTFTAFSINYKGKYYIITAGHCVSDNYGREGNFKFKANFSQEWITAELLAYKPDFWALDDYAVFYSDKIKGGLSIGENKTRGNYLLGSIDKELSIFRDLGGSSRRGESGSPVINENMEVIGIYVVYGYVFTPIQLALDAIENSVSG